MKIQLMFQSQSIIIAIIYFIDKSLNKTYIITSMKKLQTSPMRKYHQKCLPSSTVSKPNLKKENDRLSASIQDFQATARSTKKLTMNDKSTANLENKTPRQRSVSPIDKRNKSSSKYKPINKKKTLKPFQKFEKIEDYIQSYSKQRQDAISALDTYTLLIQTECPLRCLQHNSAISLYCENEQKLLCANCVYGGQQHRAHKIYPIQRVFSKLNKDIENMKLYIHHQREQLVKVEDVLYDAFDNQTQSLHEYLEEITKQYQLLRNQLDESQIIAKRNIYELIQIIRLKNQKLLLELGSYRQLFDQHDPSNNIAVQSNNLQQEDVILYRHLSYEVLCNLKKIQGKHWIQPINQIKNLAEAELKKIELILQKISLKVVPK